MTLYGKKRHLSPLWKRVPLLILLYWSFSLYSYGQQISLSVQNAPLEEVFRQIEAKTDYRFVYAREELKQARPVTLQVSSRSLERVLAQVFAGQPLSYSINKKYISVHLREPKREPAPPAPPGIEVQGRVLSEAGEPLPGASVMVKGSTTATATDEGGKFLLNNLPQESTLIVSSVGYLSREIPLNGRTSLTITLTLAVGTLDETVVIAYGKTTRRLNTGSVAKVSSRQIEKQPVSNPLAALQGRVPGLIITQANGLPGSQFEVLIRGHHSLQQGTEPLYIIDGVPFPSERLTQRSLINANNPFNTINPADIESIEILKDADATAIYGSRGANGVILITTKKSRGDKTEITAGYYTGWGTVTRTMDFLSPNQYLDMRREAFRNDGVTPDPSSAPDFFSMDTTAPMDWKKLLIGGRARSHNAQVRLSGGTLYTRFSLGANHYREGTVFPGDKGTSRTAISISATHQSENKKFGAQLSASYATDKSNLLTQDLTQYISLPPFGFELYDSSGRLNWKGGGTELYGNPLSSLVQQYLGITDRLTSSSVASYQVTPSLTLKANLGYNTLRFDETIQNPIASQNPTSTTTGSATFGANSIKTWIAEPQLEFNRVVHKAGSLLVLVGATLQESKNYSTLISAAGYSNDALLGSTAGASRITTTNASSLYRYQGVYGRLNYNLKARYLLNLTGRRDGSSRFGPGKQFANFGAVGAGWIFSKEPWMRKNFQALSFGKLRGSYGLSGNDQIGNYQFVDSYSPTRWPYQGTTSLMPSRLFNPDYSWEQVRKKEAALELGFFHDRLLLTTSFYQSRSDNQIIYFSLPQQTGFLNVLQNFPGVVENKGWEWELQSTPLRRAHLTWSTSLNLSLARNKLLAFPGLERSPYAFDYAVGEPTSVEIGYRFLGVDPQTGVYQFEDVNKDGSLDGKDYVVQGHTNPDYFGGFQNTLTYKGLELDLLFQFIRQRGRDLVYSGFVLPGDRMNQPVAVLNRWQKPGDRAPYQQFTQSLATPAGSTSLRLPFSDAVFTDASFVRLKNLSLAYRLPENWMRRAKLRESKIYLQGQNIWTITRYKGSDPENQSLLSLPPLRMLVAGFQLTL